MNVSADEILHTDRQSLAWLDELHHATDVEKRVPERVAVLFAGGWTDLGSRSGAFGEGKRRAFCRGNRNVSQVGYVQCVEPPTWSQLRKSDQKKISETRRFSFSLDLGTTWEQYRPNTREEGGAGPTSKQGESTR
jgi:hypothetical protein